MVAPVKFAPVSVVEVRLAPVRTEVCRFAPDKLALVKFARVRVAPERFMFSPSIEVRMAPVRLAPEKLWFLRFNPERLTPGPTRCPCIFDQPVGREAGVPETVGSLIPETLAFKNWAL